MTLKTDHCPWEVEVDGDDLVVRNVMATCFGGGFDLGDDGQTESGVLNDGSNPNLLGCALPIRSLEPSTAPSPLAFKGPRLPWKTSVHVWREIEGESTAIVTELIDNGPDVQRYPTHAIDLTVAAAAHFAPHLSARDLANKWGGVGFSYRILGGAKFIS